MPEHAALTRNTSEPNRLVAGHAGSVTPISGVRIVHLDQSRRLERRVGKRMVVTNGVDFVADDRTTVELLGFLELFNGRAPCFVDHVKDFHRLCVRLIACLGRVNVDATTYEKDLVGGWKVG